MKAPHIYVLKQSSPRLPALLFLLSFTIGHAADADISVCVITRAPGLSTIEVETAVTNPLERRLAEVQGAKRIESRTIAGRSIIRVSFRDDIGFAAALATVQAWLPSATNDLPRDIATPLVLPFDMMALSPVGYVAVTDKTAAEAAESARKRLLLRLNAIAGMGPVAVLGDKPRQVLIRLDPVKLAARGLTARDVAQAIKVHLPSSGSSFLRIFNIVYVVSFSRPIEGQLAAIPLGGQGGVVTKLGHVAQIVETDAAPAHSTRVAGAEKVLVPIYAASGADAGRIRDAVRDLLARLHDAAAKTTFEFLPLADGANEDDNGLIEVELRLPSGTRIEATEAERAEIEAIAREVLSADVSFIVSETGVADDWPAAFSANAAESDATIRIQLARERKTSTRDAAASLTRALEEKSGRLRGHFFVRSSDSEIVEAHVAARTPEVRTPLERMIAVLQTSFPAGRIVERVDSPGFQIQIDLRKAGDLGVAPEQIMLPVAAFSGGPPASLTDFHTGTRLQLASGDTSVTMDDLLNVPLPTARHRPVRLGDLAGVSRTVTPVEIDHFNLEPVFRLQFLIDRGERDSAIAKLAAAIKKLRTPDSPPIEIEGAPPASAE